MASLSIHQLHKKQKEYFETGATKSVDFRLKQLKKLKQALSNNEKALIDALQADFHKPSFETYMHELGQVLKELDHHIRNLKKWTKPEKRRSPLAILPSKSRIIKEPFGNVLILSPWNYPLLLLIDPLIGAISAGNTAVLKPSPYLKAFSNYIENLIGSTFSEEYIAVVHGGREINKELLELKWDYIFFTGSPYLGKIVMKAAAEHLTPVTLELGGKSPCIVDEDANLKLAAKRIVWGKFMNGGQTCIAPDYLMVHQKVKAELLEYMKADLLKKYGANPAESPDYCRVVNDGAFQRLIEYLKDGDIVTGGQTDAAQRYISPTIIDNVKPDFPVMQDEIFGPIMPVLTFSKIEEAIKFVNSNPKPLAFYYFSNNLKKAQKVLNKTSSGGGCINDCILHIANGELPFGGVGNSGMGKYHGKLSFDTFTNYRSIVFSSTKIDIPIKYAPYGNKLSWARKLL